MAYWPFWLGGTALAVVALSHYLIVGRLLGVSGNFANFLKRTPLDPLAGAGEQALREAMLAATREQFGDEAVSEDADSGHTDGDEPTPSAEPAPYSPSTLSWTSNATMLAGMMLGGTLGALSRGVFHVSGQLDAGYVTTFAGGYRGWALLAIGGVVVGFGTSMAGGCTSGHGLCGTSRLERGSLAATMSFFGTAVAVSLLWAWVQR